METSNKLTGKQLSLWTSSAEDTPANLSAPQANDEEQMTLDTSGHGYEMPLAYYDPDTQSWKTYGDISLWEEQPSLANLPKSGMTRNGVLYQLPVWVRPIDVIASLLWPTPLTNDNKAGDKKPNPNLIDAVLMRPNVGDAPPTTKEFAEHRMWPTPTADDASNVNPKPNRFRGLVAAVNDNPWPTPTYGKLAGGTGGMEQIEAKYLAGEITSEERRAMRAGNGGKLNPMWVEWLMGFPLGWTDLEASETQ